MARNRTTLWVASGVFAAAIFAAASPAEARDGRGRHDFGPRVRVTRQARPYYPRARYYRYSRFASPYYYGVSPYFYAANPYYYADPYYYNGASPYYYSSPRARRAYWPRVIYRHGHHRRY